MNWPIVKLGDLFEITSSKRVFQFEWRTSGVPFYRAREVVKLAEHGHVQNELFIDEEMYEKYKIKYGVPQSGDLLVTGVGTLGRTYLVQNQDRFYFKDGNIIWLKKRAEVCSKYIQYVFKTPSVQSYIQNSPGATVGTYTIEKAKNTEIPFPPLVEQKRIAEILDKADAIRRKRQQAIKLADEFLRAVFVDMFGDPVTNPKGWPQKKWGDFGVLKIVNGKNQKQVLDEFGKYPIIGSGGEMGRANDYLCPENTIVIGRKGNINKPLLIKEKFWNVDTAFGLVPNSNILSFNYLYWFCVFFDFERLNKTVTIPSLTKADLLEIKIPLPDISKQEKFDQIVQKINNMKTKQNLGLKYSKNSFDALSNRIFNNENKINYYCWL